MARVSRATMLMTGLRSLVARGGAVGGLENHAELRTRRRSNSNLKARMTAATTRTQTIDGQAVRACNNAGVMRH